MEAYLKHRDGYMDATRSVGMPRDIEYQLFARVTGRLNQASIADDFTKLIGALHDNLTLWKTIAFDVMDDGNDLPPMLRARLFYLYEFTQAHTRRVQRQEADISALIDVNMSIMRGLRGSDAGPQKESDTCQA